MIRDTLLVGSALALVIQAPEAVAQEKILQPVSGWAVTKVDPVNGQGDAYCALARKYTPNTVLTIARNAMGESSVAIDFQKAVFNTSRAVTVELDAGANELRQFEVRPTSRSAVVLKTGRDSEFFTGLRGSRILEASIGDDSYRFVMPDIEIGLGQLSGCLGSDQAIASRPTRDYMPRSLDADQYREDMVRHHQDVRLSELQDRMTRLESENTSLRDDSSLTEQALQAKLERLEAEKIELAAQLRAERARFEEELVSGNKDQRDKLGELEAQLAQIEATKNLELKTAQEEIERIEAEKQDLLRSNRVAMSSAQKEIDSIQAERDALMAQLDAAKQKFETESAAGQEASTAKISKLQDDLSALETKNQILLDEYESDQSRFQSQLDELKQENEVLLARLNAEREGYEEQIATSTDSSNKRLKELEHQLA